MKKFVFYAVVTFILTAVFMLAGCDTTPSTEAAEPPPDTRAAGETQGETGYAAEEGIDEKGAYTGDGGKGASITIFAPESKGLADDQQYLPELVQGELMSNFSAYSAISVFDRMNLDKIYSEALSGYYEDDDRAGIDLGHLTSTDYFMYGSITKTATGYALQLQITKTADKTIVAPYSGTFTFAELDNLIGVRRASRDMLEKLGVSLTDKAKTELGGAAAEQVVNAQIALSRGIEAMKKGTVVEALSYFVQSQSYDPQLAEAANRVNIVSANISSGNIGADARNDIAWRKAWLERLTECEQWVTNYVRNTPVPTYLYYSTDLKQEDIDYNRETLSISIEEIALRVDDRYDWAAPIIGVVNPVYAGLKATGRASAWEIGNWPNSNVARGLSALWNKIPEYETMIELVNDAGEVIGRRSVRLSAGWRTGFSSGEALSSRSMTTTDVRFTGVDANKITDRLSIRIASLNGTDVEEAAKTNSVSIVTRDEYWRTVAQRDLAFYKGDDDRALADYNEAIRLNPRAANAYYNRGLIYYNKYDYARAEADFNQAVSFGLYNAGVKELLAKSYMALNCKFEDRNIITGTVTGRAKDIAIPTQKSRFLTKYTGSSKSIVIPEQINGIPVGGIGERAFADLGIFSVVVPDTVTYIWSNAFTNGYQKTIPVKANYTKGFSISLPANIHINEGLRDPLAKFYDQNGKKAGTYIWDGKAFRYEAKR
ncbi:MAG: tetratricopeptide repeat protein [Treponema sp.]|nr:tetratricopeptide repeat protein [Treponema sp.]